MSCSRGGAGSSSCLVGRGDRLEAERLGGDTRTGGSAGHSLLICARQSHGFLQRLRVLELNVGLERVVEASREDVHLVILGKALSGQGGTGTHGGQGGIGTCTGSRRQSPFAATGSVRPEHCPGAMARSVG
jgi:hypothetical protein